MADGPRVSVVVIFLNAEPFLREAIDSVLAQSFADWELLLVDDGSSDGGTDLARAYEQRHAGRVRYMEHPNHENLGMSASRNLGIARATGEYVAFLDADDVWLPAKLGDQVAILDAHPEAAMVFGAVEMWSSWTGSPEDAGRDYRAAFFGVPLDAVVAPPDVLPLILRYGTSPSPSGVMVRRAASQRVGGFEPAFRTMYEDEVFYSKLCLDAPVFASSRCWTRRRQHADACTTVSDRTGQSRMHRLTYLTWLERRLIELPVPRPAVWEAVQEQLMSYRPALMQPPLARLSARFHAARERVARPVGRVRRRTLGQAVGTLTATPNPIHLEQTGAAVTELTWESANARELEVRLGAPDGHLVSRSGPAGRATTGDWVNNGMRFYLQDVTDGKPLTSLHTLDTVRVSLLP